MKTAAELSQALANYRVALVKNGKPPAEFGFTFDSFIKRLDEFDVSDGAKESAKFYQRMQSVGLNVDIIYAYHNFRDQLQHYQVKENISSIVDRTFSAFGVDFIYKTSDDQLTLLKSDKLVLKKETLRIAEHFCKIIERNNYILVRTINDEDWGTVTEYNELVVEVEYADSVYLRYDLNCSDQAQFPDRFLLSLHDSNTIFYALKPDKCNAEWLANARIL